MFLAHWVADVSVDVEPVSGVFSLLTGKLTGNFVIFARRRGFAYPKSAGIQIVRAEFPTRWNREFIGAYQGNGLRKQGTIAATT
jgi:hypothetical protein